MAFCEAADTAIRGPGRSLYRVQAVPAMPAGGVWLAWIKNGTVLGGDPGLHRSSTQCRGLPPRCAILTHLAVARPPSKRTQAWS